MTFAREIYIMDLDPYQGGQPFVAEKIFRLNANEEEVISYQPFLHSSIS